MGRLSVFLGPSRPRLQPFVRLAHLICSVIWSCWSVPAASLVARSSRVSETGFFPVVWQRHALLTYRNHDMPVVWQRQG